MDERLNEAFDEDEWPQPTCEDAAALQVVLASTWIGAELENANYHSVRHFLEELRSEAVAVCNEGD